MAERASRNLPLFDDDNFGVQTIEFSKNYLLSDLDQISDSLTLVLLPCRKSVRLWQDWTRVRWQGKAHRHSLAFPLRIAQCTNADLK